MSDGHTAEGPLAIIAGAGRIPFAIAESVVRRGRDVVLFPLRGWADAEAVKSYPHHWIAVGQGGHLMRHARAAGCRDLVFVGALARPPFRSLRIDWVTLKILPELYRIYRGGDDHLLSGVARLFQQHGFRIVGAHEVAPEILIPAGRIGTLAPSERDLEDIALGLRLLHATSPFDVGQAAIVANGRVLAVEAADGTDEMLKHVEALRANGRVHTPRGTGVLIKAPKTGQDRRIDLPAIGPRTIEGVARAGLAGIAVMARSAIMAEADRLASVADGAKVFVYGIDDQTPS